MLLNIQHFLLEYIFSTVSFYLHKFDLPFPNRSYALMTSPSQPPS